MSKAVVVQSRRKRAGTLIWIVLRLALSLMLAQQGSYFFYQGF